MKIIQEFYLTGGVLIEDQVLCTRNFFCITERAKSKYGNDHHM